MYVVSIPNRGSPPAILLRESYREGSKVRNRTLANLTAWPREKVEALRRAQLSVLENPAYAHPFFWAPFILIGDWR